MAKEKYYLYIDESGWRYPEKEPPARNDGMDYFALGGVLIRGMDRDEVIGKHARFCNAWSIDYPLHSTDIRGRRGDFAWLKDDGVNEKFSRDLLEFMCDIPVVGFAVVIDRVGYNNRYKERYGGKPWWMCKTAFAVLVERVSKYVIERDRRFKIILENIGAKEEKAFIEYFRSLRKEGPPFDTATSAKYGVTGPELFQQVPYGDPEYSTKKSPLVQLADLYLYPMAKGGYDKTYYPYQTLLKRGKLIDALLPQESVETRGIKYSCFDNRQ